MLRPRVDPLCFDLAEYFLPADADEQRKWDLAATIQAAAEAWLIHEDRAAHLREEPSS
jgi:hypothetical protein